MFEPDEEVTLRRLPDGAPERAVQRASDGQLLRIELSPAANSRELAIGTLVEVESRQNLYLGEVQGRQGPFWIVGVEHRMDRSVLAAIESVWRLPQGA